MNPVESRRATPRRNARRTRALHALVAGALLAAAAVAAVSPAPATAQPPSAHPGPQELMYSVSRRMLAELDQNRAAIRSDPTTVRPIVERVLLPHFDTDYAAQLILAQHWRSATSDQRRRFVAALTGALARSYGGALTDVTAERLKILPFRGDPAATIATVRSLVTRGNGQQVPVDYRLRKTADGWKAFDVVIEGISYVRNYRNDLGAEVRERGLEAVIARLERGEIDVDPRAGTVAARPVAAS